MNKYEDLTREQYKAFMQFPLEGPIQMLNLLRFKRDANGDSSIGAKQYSDYMEAAGPFLKKSKAKVLYYGKAKFSLIGPTDKEWDKVIIVEYANKADFVAMISNPEYPATIRRAALEDSRLILCQP